MCELLVTFLHKQQAGRPGHNIVGYVIFVPACCGETWRTLHIKGFTVEYIIVWQVDLEEGIM